MKKVHYAWVSCAVGMLMYFCNMGLCNNAMSVFLPFIESAEGFSGAQGSTIMTVRCISSLISMYFVAVYYDRIGMRLGAALATAISAVSFLIYSVGGHTYVYYLGAAVAGVGYSLGAIIPASILINNWFNRRRGLALSLATAGTGLCSVLTPSLITSIVENAGLSAALRCVFVFDLVCALLMFLLTRETPAVMGLEPYGEGQDDTSRKGRVKSHGVRCMKPAEWVFIGIAMIFVGAVSTGSTGHLTILLTTSSFSSSDAALVFSLWGLMLIVGKLLYGVLSDYVGGMWSMVICYSVYVLGCLSSLLFIGGNLALGFVFACLMGVGMSTVTVGPPVWAADLSTPPKYSRTLKIMQMCYTVGGVIFTSVPGILYDILGNYQSAYMMYASFAVTSTVIVCVLYLRFAKSKRRAA